MKEISRLLIAYDGSNCSDEALEDLKRAGLPKQLEAVVLSVAALVFVPPDDQLTADEVVSPGTNKDRICAPFFCFMNKDVSGIALSDHF